MCVEGFPSRVWPKTLKWVVVYSIASTMTGRPCVYTVTVGWHVLCLYCDGLGYHVLCLYTVMECGIMYYVYIVTGLGDMSCVCILWRGGMAFPVSAAWHSSVAAHWSKYGTTATSRHCRDMAADVKETLIPNKQKFLGDCSVGNSKVWLLNMKVMLWCFKTILWSFH